MNFEGYRINSWIKAKDIEPGDFILDTCKNELFKVIVYLPFFNMIRVYGKDRWKEFDPEQFVNVYLEDV